MVFVIHAKHFGKICLHTTNRLESESVLNPRQNEGGGYDLVNQHQ